MEATEYLKLATDKTEAGDLIKENNLTEAVVKLMSNYAEFRVKNCSIPAVVGRSEQLVCDCKNCKPLPNHAAGFRKNKICIKGTAN